MDLLVKNVAENSGQKGGVRKMLKIIGFIIVAIILIVVLFLAYAALKPAVPGNYETAVKTGGDIEAKYIAHGSCDVKYTEQRAMQNYKKYEIYYPAELETSGKEYPIIVISNGTGIKGSKAKHMFEHFASWGFIVIGNEEEYSWNGFSAEMSLRYLLRQNDDPESIFYHKIDTDNIGALGHSQGGVGAINAVTDTKHKDIYKTVVAESPAHWDLASGLEWDYDISNLYIPFLMVAGTEKSDAELVCTLDGMNKLFDLAEQSPLKVMARRTGAEHGEMLYSADGYVTAWFMWQLQGDEYAAGAFTGDTAEIMQNSLYQDQRSKS